MPVVSISANYTPDASATLVSLWKIVQLSQRDVSAQIPINHVAHPGVSLTSACFSNKVCEEQALVRCMSNLLAVDNRRFHVDLYWSEAQQRWIFCPATVDSNAPTRQGSPNTPLIGSVPQGNSSIRRMDRGDLMQAREAKTPSSNSLPSMANHAARVTESTTPEKPSTSAPVLYSVGSYSCSKSLDLSTFLSFLESYFWLTNDTLNAHMLYILINLHSAAAADSPDKSSNAPSPGKHPSGANLLGSLFEEALQEFMYTPKKLEEERSNLNRSWYSVPSFSHPISEYYTTHKDSKGLHSTPDGWPCESYVERTRLHRFLVGWGTVDPQMASYNFNGDNDLIFPEGSLSTFREIKTSNANNEPAIEFGCLFDPEATDASNPNASWAESTAVQQYPYDPTHVLSSELMACGISPTINSSLSNMTADVDFKPYQNASRASQWAWVPGEPMSADLRPEPSTNLRCARADVSFKGRWVPAKCSSEFYGACRIGNQPFRWALTPHRVPYDKVSHKCPKNSTFSTPRTSLENTYLYHHLMSMPQSVINASSANVHERSVWIDLNSLDVANCWVSGGPQTQCPYEVDYAAVQLRAVLVPTIAAIIVLVIAALTIFVKCNSNRRNSRRTRVIEGWEYEGVPS
ncbi:hypothetical protein ACO22_02465 [Paracoccidioides brasiliensis]|uniref:Maintenance of telomere capping protein 6 n=1 Tax=Paracoccidioides brasiliensis TaxID=121759 RepID=A0A1D2JIM5_PARBR|nr:hypothetical protein ACO22_02465 [Paracoccidioides brasiliensis]